MKRGVLFGCMGFSLAALCVPAMMTMPISIVYNPSDSVPRGWYRVSGLDHAESLQIGSIVLAKIPADVAVFAAQRGYLPSGVPILKRIGAMGPQLVCVREQVVRIDGEAVATARFHDSAHRPLSAWAQCRPLAGDELFLLSDTNSASFDSRYFGPIDASSVLGIARPLWTWGVR